MKFVGRSAIDGAVAAPPSKSMMVRAVAAASLADGVSEIRNPSYCGDSAAAIEISRNLGASIETRQGRIYVEGGNPPLRRRLDCRESGLCIRMFAAIASLYDKEMILEARGSLRNRPVEMVREPLAEMGVWCATNAGYPPVVLRGPLKGGMANVDSSTSSQFLSGLLMALPLCRQDSTISVSRLKSLPYVRMTMALLEAFGVSISADDKYSHFDVAGNQKYAATRYDIEGDYSGAAFLLVAGAIAGKVKVQNLNSNSLQADHRIIEALRRAGASVVINDSEVQVEERRLMAFEFDASDCPDLFPPLVALACNCEGTSEIAGVDRLKYKESNRTEALLTEFGKMGARMFIKDKRLLIQGSRLVGAEIQSHNDHRIAMACAVGALCSKEGVVIKDHECVSKSYSNFFQDLSYIGATVR